MDDFIGNGLSLSPGSGVAVPNITEPTVDASSSAKGLSESFGSLGGFLGPIGSIAGGVIGGLFGKSSAKKQQADAYGQMWQQNIWNAAQASAAREWSALEAEKQRGFQAQMSGTAHQREVADLAAAGLNPILSVSKGGPGSSTPAGAAGQSFAAAPASAAAVPDYGASSARGAEVGRLLTSGVLQAIAQLEKIQAETDEIHARASNTRVDSWLKTRYGSLAMSQANTEDFKPGLMTEQARQARASALLSDFERTSLKPAEVKLTEARTSETAASAKHAEMVAKVSSSDFALYMEYLKRLTGNIPGFGVLLGK